MTDVIWDNSDSGGPLADTINEFERCIESLCYENFDKIKEMFKDGYTTMLIPDLMEWLENSNDIDIMLRVFGRNGVLIGTLTKSQLKY